MNYYICHGLHITSEIPLLLTPSVEQETTDVAIHFGRVPDALSDHDKTESQFILKINGIAHFLISNGSEIIISPLTDDHNLISVFLYGSCFSVLLKQRGILTLHANAININDKAILIAGPQKAGKSTLTGAFLLADYSIISDDVCVVKIIDDQPVVLSGTPFIKLTQNSLEQLDQKKLSSRILNSVYEKYRIGLGEQHTLKPTPISAFFSIDIYDKDHIASNRLGGIESITTLIKNVYRPNYPLPNSFLTQYRNNLMDIAKKVSFYGIERPSTWFSAFELRAHILELIKPNVTSVEKNVPISQYQNG